MPERLLRAVAATQQLTLDFEPGLTEKHGHCLDVIREGAYTNRNPLKTIAADMDMSQSELSRKLAGHPEDPRHFTLLDLEKYVNATGDVQPIYWLVEKFLTDESLKQQRAMSRIAAMLPDLEALLKAVKGAA